MRTPNATPAEKAATAILADLCDRRGIKQELARVDARTVIEIHEAHAEIIQAAIDGRPQAHEAGNELGPNIKPAPTTYFGELFRETRASLMREFDMLAEAMSATFHEENVSAFVAMQRGDDGEPVISATWSDNRGGEENVTASISLEKFIECTEEGYENDEDATRCYVEDLKKLRSLIENQITDAEDALARWAQEDAEGEQ